MRLARGREPGICLRDLAEASGRQLRSTLHELIQNDLDSVIPFGHVYPPPFRRNLVGIQGADGVDHGVRGKAFCLLAIGVGGGI